MLLLANPLLFALSFFFFNDTATTEIYTLSLHDALPIWCTILISTLAGSEGRVTERESWRLKEGVCVRTGACCATILLEAQDRKSTRLNSSHSQISYAVFCLKKKNST